MATQIIVLEKQPAAQPVFRVAFWVPVPTARQRFYANAEATSAWADAQAADITALKNGSVVEKVETVSADPGTTIPAIQSRLIARWTALQAELAAETTWQRYGTTYDGTAWTAGGF